MNRPVPLLLKPGVISNIPPFVMSQQGRTNLVVWGIARTIYLIKGETASVLMLFTFLIIILAPNLRFGKMRDSQGARQETAPPHLHYRLFNLSLYLAVLYPGINHLFNPLIKLVKLPWFPLQELLLQLGKYTTRRLYEQFRNKLKSNTLYWKAKFDMIHSWCNRLTCTCVYYIM